MELQDVRDGWHLELHDCLVQLIQIDFRLCIFLSDVSGKAQLYIETPCRLKSANTDVLLKPAEPSSLAPILPLFNSKVTALTIQNTGQLKVQFVGDHLLEVAPNASYEAWQLGCSTGVMLVCSPGGKVSVFNKK